MQVVIFYTHIGGLDQNNSCRELFDFPRITLESWDRGVFRIQQCLFSVLRILSETPVGLKIGVEEME